MPKASTIAAVMTGVLPLAVVAGVLLLWNHSPSASSAPHGDLDRVTEPLPIEHAASTEPVADPEPPHFETTPVPTSSLVRTASHVIAVEPAPTEPQDEASCLATLHDLAAADPPQSLRLARQAVRRFANTPNAPEFQWNVVKALFNLGRLDEARNEARAMLAKYPNSSFTGDVVHHLLNPPPNPPTP
jgi:hypothetical protein